MTGKGYVGKYKAILLGGYYITLISFHFYSKKECLVKYETLLFVLIYF